MAYSTVYSQVVSIIHPYGEFFELMEESHCENIKEVELDEMWTLVGQKTEQRWIWLAGDRHSPRIVGMAIGDRSAQIGKELGYS